MNLIKPTCIIFITLFHVHPHSYLIPRRLPLRTEFHLHRVTTLLHRFLGSRDSCQNLICILTFHTKKVLQVKIPILKIQSEKFGKIRIIKAQRPFLYFERFKLNKPSLLFWRIVINYFSLYYKVFERNN